MLRRWERAAHCEIGKEHPEAYAAALRAFLRPEAWSAAASARAANNIKPFVRASRRVAAAEMTE